MIEIKLWRSTYNFLLVQKELFIEKSKMATLTIEQKAEAELSLASMTGELKRIDNAILAMQFGYLEYAPECNALSIHEIVTREQQSQRYVEMLVINREVKSLKEANRTLKSQCNYLQSKLNLKDANTTTKV